jgi:hypothetical protein
MMPFIAVMHDFVESPFFWSSCQTGYTISFGAVLICHVHIPYPPHPTIYFYY